MGITRTFRFREYRISHDGSGMPSFEVVCVSGEEADCGARSGEVDSVAELHRWIAEHVRDSGHHRFKRGVWDYATAEPGEWQ